MSISPPSWRQDLCHIFRWSSNFRSSIQLALPYNASSTLVVSQDTDGLELVVLVSTLRGFVTVTSQPSDLLPTSGIVYKVPVSLQSKIIFHFLYLCHLMLVTIPTVDGYGHNLRGGLDDRMKPIGVFDHSGQPIALFCNITIVFVS